MPPTTQPNPNDPTVIALSKAIAQNESGMNPNAVGDAGTSHGMAQWQSGTWKAEAQDVLGDPNAPMTPQNQKAVLATTVAEWKAQGLNPAQIAAKWNSGSPDNWENKIGTTTINGKQIAYDVPKYVKNVTDLYNQYKVQTTPAAANNQDVSADTLQSQPSEGGITANTVSGDAGNPFSQYANATVAPSSTSSDPGLLNDLGNDLGTAASGAGNALSEAATGQINPISGVLQTAGAVGGGINSGVNDLLTHIPVLGGVIKGGENLIGQGVGALANTSLGQKAVGAGESFAQSHPELAGDIGAVGNIAGALGTFEGAGALKDIAGEAIGKAVGKDALSSVVDDISPEIKAGTKAGAKNVAKNGVSKGFLGSVNRVADPAMTEAAPVVIDNIPDFSKLPTYADKLNAVENTAIPNEANKLRTALQSPDVQTVVNPDNYQKFLDGISKSIETSPGLIGDSGEYAKRFLNLFQTYLPKGADATAEDVLNARQALDKAALSYKPKVFDQAATSAYSAGLDAVRSGANDLIAEMAPDAAVKASLRRQSLLYRVADNLAAKADKEVGTNAITRFAGRHPGIIKAGKYVGTTALTGLGLGEAQNLFGGK